MQHQPGPLPDPLRPPAQDQAPRPEEEPALRPHSPPRVHGGPGLAAAPPQRPIPADRRSCAHIGGGAGEGADGADAGLPRLLARLSLSEPVLDAELA
eukprot:scaffold343517_cov46-Prasinocladus_malaysianus.AAC.1